MTQSNDIGLVLRRLEEAIASRKGDDPKSSYTASLLAAGKERCAKKLGEEGVEAALAGAAGNAADLTEEAADLLYHLIVLLTANDVTLSDVANALTAREGTSGHTEKANRPGAT